MSEEKKKDSNKKKKDKDNAKETEEKTQDSQQNKNEDIQINSQESKDKKVEEQPKPSYFGEPIKKGDLIKLEMVGSTVPTITEKKSIVFQATNIEDARKMPNFDPKKANLYTPELVLVGEKGFVLDKINEELLNMKYGEEKTIILEPKDAFGERDSSKIEKIGYNKYKKIMNEEPRIGSEFHDEKGRHGTVIFVDQGRVRIDFNHPLAGRKVQYKVKAIARIDKLQEKIKEFIMRRIPNSVSDLFEININDKDNEVNIKMPEYLALQQNLGYIEFSIAYELQNYLKLGTINFIHSFKKHELKSEEVKESEKQVESTTNQTITDKKK